MTDTPPMEKNDHEVNVFDEDPMSEPSNDASWWQKWWQWLRDRTFFKESSYVASIYGDTLRDNFIFHDGDGTDIPALKRLKEQFNAETSRDRPRLEVLLKIEAHLVHALPADVTKQRFWAILDRFERVVPAATRAQYWATVPPRGSGDWNDEKFYVKQARTLLDTIHSNYSVNTGREKSTRRLKLILLFIFILTSIGLGGWYNFGDCVEACKGQSSSATANAPMVLPHSLAYAVLAYAGMLGAIMSIIQRLQTAVSHDAMTTDGVFELTGLRLGWTGIVLSVISGGIFALVLYFIVMAGLFTAAVPAAVMDDKSPSAQTMVHNLKAKITHLNKRREALSKGMAALPDATPPASGASTAAAPTAADLAKRATALASIEQEIAEKERDLEFVEAEAAVMAPEVDANATNGDTLATALGLGGGASFFKMLILAFLAGFAERMVPDILERLRKNVNGS